MATLAVFLVSTAEELTAAFTILGTLAGYIAGATPEGVRTEVRGSGINEERIVTE